MYPNESRSGEAWGSHPAKKTRTKDTELSPPEMVLLLLAPLLLLAAVGTTIAVVEHAGTAVDYQLITAVTEDLAQWRDSSHTAYVQLYCEDIGAIVQDEKLATTCVTLGAIFKHKSAARNWIVASNAFLGLSDCDSSPLVTTSAVLSFACAKEHAKAATFLERHRPWTQRLAALLLGFAKPIWLITAAASLVLAVTAIRCWATYMDARAMPGHYESATRDRNITADAYSLRTGFKLWPRTKDTKAE